MLLSLPNRIKKELELRAKQSYLLARERVMTERKNRRKGKAAAMAGANFSTNVLYKIFV